ncbi:peptidoglycan-binding protein [Streptomyces sp. NPDC059875]|uniref:peptidoglycan-binding domain-containing protein n=1 Tax=unclassified Streptomyces TaxID=2593676 RepID=UPI00364A89A3
MSGHVCPECGDERRPGCAACLQAEIAAAEDFDPLRIRPYVTLDAPEPGPYEAPPAPPAPAPIPGPAAPASEALSGQPVAPAAGDHAETMPLLLPGIAAGPAPDAVAYDGYDSYVGPDGYAEPEPRPATRRRGALVALAAAVAVAVIATAAVAGGLLDDGTTDDRAAVPTVTTSASENVAVSEEPSTPPSTSASASTSPSPSRSASTSPSPSATRTAQATTSAPATPPSPSATRTTTAPTTPPAPTQATPGPTLRYGDSGAEVEELQRRLTQVYAYDGRIDGEYSRQVRRAVEWYQEWQYIQEDEEGVYGPETRRALEAETTG